ncbi:MAG: ATP/GTP-binding protein [Salibacteraceae bacterium]
MLVEFSVGNYLSFKEVETLDFTATRITEYNKNVWQNFNGQKLLKSVVVYGANASGKSNLVKALTTVRDLILYSSDGNSSTYLPIIPFLLSTNSSKQTSVFEVIIIANERCYRYGFEADKERIHGEWLFERKGSREKTLFTRDQNQFDIGAGLKERSNLEQLTRPNALFLSVLDKFNEPIAGSIIHWFTQFVPLSGLGHESHKLTTLDLLDQKGIGKAILDFYKNLDLGFHGIITQTIDSQGSREFQSFDLEVHEPQPEIRNPKRDVKVFTLHDLYNEDQDRIGEVEFSLGKQESQGTNKIFNIAGLIFKVLSQGGVLAIDELDTSLHPLLTLEIIKLFRSPEANPRSAQLIFTTHDTNLLTYGRFRRDQIYFTEKDQYGATHLYSLIEYREQGQGTIRKDRSFEKDYLEGRYGAVPFPGKVQDIIEKWQGESLKD